MENEKISCRDGDVRCALVWGCGRLGRRLAVRLLEAGYGRVFGTTRDQEKVEGLVRLGVEPVICDVNSGLTLHSISKLPRDVMVDVFYCVAPGGEVGVAAETLTRGLSGAILAMKGLWIGRGIYVSSTGVYGQKEGQVVDADTVAVASNGRGKFLLSAEGAWVKGIEKLGGKGHVVRMAGLYDCGRVVGKRGLVEGKPIVGDADAVLNLIHTEDAAELLLAVAEAENAGVVELGCDDGGVMRRTYYDDLAEAYGLARPIYLGDADAELMGVDVGKLRGSSNKICCNAITKRRCDWEPKYRSYREGLFELFGRKI